MIIAEPPANERERIEKLQEYRVLDTTPEASFDRITRIVAETIDVPMALVSLVDESRQWFKSSYGLDVEQTPRDVAFCAHTILGDELMEIVDAREDPRFAGNPLVTDDPAIRFYAGAPLRTPDGFMLGTLCAIDMVPRKLSVRHRLLLEDLAELVVDELELRRAKYLAEHASAAKSRFLAAASHDLRQPLQAISFYLDVVAQTDDTDQRRQIIDKAENSLVAVNGLLGTLLDVTKLDSGMIEPRTEKFSVRRALSLSKEFEVVGQEHRLRFKSVMSDCEIESDPGLLDVILRNLLLNAFKYTTKGGVLFGCRRRRDILSIEVWDTGQGIAADDLDLIFEDYFQVGNSARDRTKGVGLGLSIVKRMADILGHRIVVRSQEGRGSVFAIEVPCVQ